MPDRLCIPCAEVDGDGLEISQPVDEWVWCTVTVEEAGSRNQIILDEEGARQLFNWLGVWLHTR